MKTAFLFALIFISSLAQAQQPLSKKDQKKKAEFEALIAAEEKYEELRAKADLAFRNWDYANARMYYNESIQYNKEAEQWLISKVNDLDILMAEIIAREVDSVSIIQRKEVLPIKTKEVVESREIETRETVPELVEPKTEEVAKIEIEELPVESAPVPEEIVEEDKQIEGKPIEPKVVKVAEPKPKTPAQPRPKEPVKTEEKELEDYSAFPQGRSDETFTFPDHTVRRVVIRDKRDVIVYKYVTHRWGGKFYFKDGVSIVDRIWKQEVTKYEQQFPVNLAEKTE